MSDATMIDDEGAAGGVRTLVMAGLSYLGILCFVPLLMTKDDEFVYFHAKQGLVLWMWSVLALFALQLPAVGKWLFSMSSMCVVVLSVAGLVSVLLRRAWRLPVISGLADLI